MKITITRLEGPNSEVSRTFYAKSFADADIQLSGWSATTPESGYDKCKCVIEDDENIFYFQYNLKRWTEYRSPSFKAQVLQELGFLSGQEKPDYMTQERYDQLILRQNQTSKDFHSMLRLRWDSL